MRQRPAGGVIIPAVLSRAAYKVQVCCLCTRPVCHAIDGDATTGLVILSSAYWCLSQITWCGRYAGNTVGNDDAFKFPVFTATDARASMAAIGCNSASVDGDSFAGTNILIRCCSSGPYSCCTITAIGSYCAAVNSDVANIGAVATSYTRAVISSCGCQATAATDSERRGAASSVDGGISIR